MKVTSLQNKVSRLWYFIISNNEGIVYKSEAIYCSSEVANNEGNFKIQYEIINRLTDY